MISDEMRELVSAYVDGELRDADAARVEEFSKRDPQLRAEIRSYRLLRGKLRQWDAAEHGGAPSPRMFERALQRARAYVSVHMAGASVAPAGWRRFGVAAALLLALGGGLLVAIGTEPGAPRGRVVTVGEGLELAPVAPLAERTERPPLALDAADWNVPDWHRPADEVLRRYLRPARNEPMSSRGEELLALWHRQEAQIRRVREATDVRTGTWNLAVQTLLGGYAPGEVTESAMVRLTHSGMTGMPAVAPLPVGKRVAQDQHSDHDSLFVFIREGRPALLLAGEVLVGLKDSRERTRIATASHWIKDTERVEVTWADRDDRPAAMTRNLVALGFVLGPKGRRAALVADGKDEGFLNWLRANYGKRPLRQLIETGAKERERVVQGLVRALAADGTATGFAVVSAGRILGVELFATHELMLASAPRLLHGYAFEAGPDGLGLEKPDDVAGRLRLAKKLLDDIPQRASRVETLDRGTRADWPKGLKCVHLREPQGRIVGHGLVLDDRPLHLTLFGD